MSMKLRAITVPIAVAGAVSAFGLGFVADKALTSNPIVLAQAEPPRLSPVGRPAPTAEQLKQVEGIVRALGDSEANKLGKLFDLVQSGKALGYDSNVAVGPYDSIELVFTKHSIESRGLLNAKWSQRETVQLHYAKAPDGYYLSNADKTVEEKSPIGEWQIIRKAKDIPAPIWAETLSSGERRQ